MEKEAFFGSPIGLSWQMQSPDSAAPLPELSSGYLNLTWDQTIDQSAQFESALSSLVSSPSSNHPAAAAGDSVVIRELIGRLGSICNSDEISPPSSHYQSTNNSCYSTPLNSPPKLNLSMVANPAAVGAHMPFSADPGFSKRAARYSSFGGSGGQSYGGGLFMLPEAGKLSRVSSSQSLKAAAGQLSNRMSVSNNGELVIATESSASGNAKKRKATSKGKGKETPLSSSITVANNPPKSVEADFNAKRSKPSEEAGEAEKDSNKPKAEQDGDRASKTQEKEKSTKPLEPLKDYIHVRARRGQATDSHSLAERVRREKISERMKFLQDLVPGCNKVTGKAVMLDEIINYVQSLQHQVEFLSMKLATVNPQLEFNMDNFVPKDIHQTCGHLPPQPVYPLEVTSRAFSITNPTQGNSLTDNGLELQCQLNLSRNHSMQLPPLEGLADASSQLGAFWDDDLHTVVQMSFSQNQENIFSSQSFQGSMTTNHMKIEL